MGQAKDLILIKKDKLDKIFLKAKNENPIITAFNISSTFCITLLISIFTTDTYKFQIVESIFWILAIILFIFAIVSFIIKKKEILSFYANPFGNIIQEIEKDSEYKEEQTLIVLNPKKDKARSGELLFPVKIKQFDKDNSHFFYYLKNDKNQYWNKNEVLNIDNMKNDIKNNLNINIPFEIHYLDLDGNGTVCNPNEPPKDVYFKFFHIHSQSPFLRTYLHKIFENDNNKHIYKSINELMKEFGTIAYNRIAITNVKNNIHKIIDSIEKNDTKKSKIVWNVDKNCKIGCAICAYGKDNAVPITLQQKKGIVDAIKEIDVDYIDFAMGANPNISEIKELLEYAKKKFSKTTKIRITATANTIEELGVDFLKTNKIEVDITYDCSDKIEQCTEHRPPNYNKDNFNIIKNLTSNGIKVHAHIVIHEKNTENYHLKEIINGLKSKNINEIMFIRLMPVGNMIGVQYPNVLNTKNTYNEMLKISNADNNKKVKLHCAFGGLINKKNPCKLGYSKLGISQNGDVFTCPWAEHLKISNSENPFFIGNIIDSNFNFIDLLLKSKTFMNTLSDIEKNQPHCKIFTYENQDIFSRNDPLYD